MSAATFLVMSCACSCSMSGSRSARSSCLAPTSPLSDAQIPRPPPLDAAAAGLAAPGAPSSSSSSSSSTRSPKRSLRSTFLPWNTLDLGAPRSSFFEKSSCCLLSGFSSPSQERPSLPFFAGDVSSSPLAPFFFPGGPPPARSLARLAAICSAVSASPPLPVSSSSTAAGSASAALPIGLSAALSAVLLAELLPPTAQLSLLPCRVLANFLDSVNARGLLAALSLRSSSAFSSSSAWILSKADVKPFDGNESSRPSGAMPRSTPQNASRTRSSSSSTYPRTSTRW